MEKLLLRPKEISEVFGIGKAKTYELLKVLPTLKLGGSIRVPVEALRVWIAEHTNTN